MSLSERLQSDMKAALRAAEKVRLSVVRMAMAAVKDAEIAARKPLDDAQEVGVIEKMIKQRRDSAAQYAAAKRADLAERESAEIEILEAYLPEPLSESELDALIGQVIEATGATTMRDMGRVMAQIKGLAQGRADMGAVSARVKACLGA